MHITLMSRTQTEPHETNIFLAGNILEPKHTEHTLPALAGIHFSNSHKTKADDMTLE